MAPHPGGGGLVILPHKSWNVWNQDNKAKVARDERANAQLIEAKEKCSKNVLQQIRFERLTGKTISKQEEQQRIEYALDNININDYIKDESMQNIAKTINDKHQKQKEMIEPTFNGKNKYKKRRYKDMMNVNEEEIKYKPRKRHKRNDVSIIEDHYNKKSKFEFDPNQYKKTNNNNRDYIDNNNNNNKNNNDAHFSLFNERKYKNPDIMFEEKKKKEMKEYQFKFGKTEIESRKTKKPWYLMTNQRQKNRRMLMKSDEIQCSLPYRLKDYNRNTEELKAKAVNKKNIDDPMNLMNKYLNKEKKESMDNKSITCNSMKINKRDLEKQKKRLLLEIKRERKEAKKKWKRYDRDNSDYSDYDDIKRSKKKKSKKKKKKHRDHKSSQKHRKHSHRY